MAKRQPLPTFESFSEGNISSLDDLLNVFKSNPNKYRMVVGSGTERHNKPDKEWLTNQVESIVDVYFYDEYYEDELSDDDKDKYQDKLEEFKKDIIKNFGKFYKEWMTSEDNREYTDFTFNNKLRDKAKNFIKI